MLISWIRKTTLLDYPWKVSTIVFTLWCDFRCHFCHNYEFVLPDKVQNFMNDLIPETAFFNFLETRKWFLDWVVISGWEPTLQKDLKDFIKRIKEMWFLIKLDTNWRDPDLILWLIKDGLIDYVAMDYKFPFERYSDIVWIDKDFSQYKKTAKILIDADCDYEFRTTVIRWYHNEEIIREMWEVISWAKRWYLQNYEDKNILNSAFDWRPFAPEELLRLTLAWKQYVSECNYRK